MGKQNQAQIAYDSILRDIKENQLTQGQPIIEEEYAKKLDMSRTPVREAIRLLSVEGFVTVYPRKGAYVSVLTAEDVKECYEMMEAVEGMIAYLAAQQPSTEHVNQLTELIGRMNEQKVCLTSISGRNMTSNFTGPCTACALISYSFIMWKSCSTKPTKFRPGLWRESIWRRRQRSINSYSMQSSLKIPRKPGIIHSRIGTEPEMNW